MKNESMPAFPLPFGNDGCPLLLGLPENSEDMLKKLQPAFGLTKLEYFAASALQGIYASMASGFTCSKLQAAEKAISAAQALIAELEKHQ